MMSDIKLVLLLVLSSYLHGPGESTDGASCVSKSCMDRISNQTRSTKSSCDSVYDTSSQCMDRKMCSRYSCQFSSKVTVIICAKNRNNTQNLRTSPSPLACSEDLTYTLLGSSQLQQELDKNTCCEIVEKCLQNPTTFPYSYVTSTNPIPSTASSVPAIATSTNSVLLVITSTIRLSPTPSSDLDNSNFPFPLPAVIALSVILGIFSLSIIIALGTFVFFQRKKACRCFTRHQQEGEFHWMQFHHAHSNMVTNEHICTQSVPITSTRAREQTLESNAYAELTEFQSTASASYTEQGEHMHRAELTSSPGEAAESSILSMSSDRQHTYEEVDIKSRDFDSSGSGSFHSSTSTSGHSNSNLINDHIYHVLEGPVQVNNTDASYRHSLQPQCVTSNASAENQETALTVASKHRDTSWGDLERELKQWKEEEKEEEGEEEDVAEELQMKKEEEEEEKEEEEEEEEEKEEGEEGEHTLAVMCSSKERLLASAIDYIDSEPLFDDPAYEDPLKLQASISITKERVITATEDHDIADKNAIDVPDECLFDDPCYQTTASWQSKNVPPVQDGH